MQSGDLRHRVAFDQRAFASDGHGNVEGDFAEEFQRWANVRPKLGGETAVSGRLEGRNLVNITVWQDENTLEITSGWRARGVEGDIAGKIYDIRSAIDPNQNTEERGKWIELLAELGGNLS